jgi:signal peptidase I
MSLTTPSPITSLPKKASPALKVFGWAFSLLLIILPSVLHSVAGIGISPILTGSMRPYAHPGDIFITKTTKVSHLHVGDIIAIHSATTGVIYAHRIVEIRGYNGLVRIITKGDSNGVAERDPYLASPNADVPRNIARVRWLGRLMIYLNSAQGRQAALRFLVGANVLVLLTFVFKKRIPKTSKVEGIYRELYMEEMLKVQEKQELLNHMSIKNYLVTDDFVSREGKNNLIMEELK